MRPTPTNAMVWDMMEGGLRLFAMVYRCLRLFFDAYETEMSAMGISTMLNDCKPSQTTAIHGKRAI
jgi:hypothetical protein